MITESYVSFDTAKLLKEAGFDVPCEHWYDEEGLRDCDYKAFQRPTQTLAARWLREVHDITVDVFFNPPKQEKPWNFFIGEMEDLVWAGDFMPSDKRYATYEEAMEDAIRQALRRIIKNKENEKDNVLR